MTQKFCITADVNTNSADNPVGLEVWIDDSKVQDIDKLTDATTVSIELEDADNDAEHELKFVLKNKTHSHTTLDDHGNIVQDSVITISNLKFDEVELGQTFFDQAVYTHNFNSNGPETKDKFYGTMGCNGVVTLRFTTPMYLWLLENM